MIPVRQRGRCYTQKNGFGDLTGFFERNASSIESGGGFRGENPSRGEFTIPVNNASFMPRIGAPMRNYVQGFGMQWIGQTILGDYALVAIGGSEEELKSQIAVINAQTEADAAPNTVIFIYQDLSKFYWLLDKEGVVRMMRTMNYASWQAAALYGTDNQKNNPYIDVIMNPEESPRYTGWKDSDAVERKPPPTDKKAPGGTVNIKSVADAIGLTINALYSFVYDPRPRAGAASLALAFIGQLNGVLNALLLKQISEATASSRYSAILDKINASKLFS